MGQIVPEDDLPGSLVPESDLPNLSVPDTDIGQLDVGAVPQLPVSGYGAGVGSQLAQTPLGQNAGRIMQPYAAGASKLMGQYAANPITKLAPDLIAATNLYPPPYATAQLIGSTQGAYNVARQPPGRVPGPVPPAPTAAEIASNQIPRSMRTNEMAARQAALETESLANRTMIQKLAMNKVMQTMAPVLNTAGRIAGPAGMAMNLYEAGQMAQDTQLGSRLAQGQGQRAEAGFRSMNVPYGGGFTQNITQQQAQNILAAGSPRDIEAFGGTEFLRKKALGL